MKFHAKYPCLISLALAACSLSAHAYCMIPNGYQISYGQGNPNSLWGGHLDLTYPGISWSSYLSNYWLFGLGQWTTHGDQDGRYTSLTTLALAPVFRLQTQDSYFQTHPFIELSVGPALLSKTRLGERNLGAHWAFQDLLGVGFAFGQRQQYSLSYHYLHYSNADLASHNAGIDVKSLISFAYRFG